MSVPVQNVPVYGTELVTLTIPIHSENFVVHTVILRYQLVVSSNARYGLSRLDAQNLCRLNYPDLEYSLFNEYSTVQ